MVYEVESAIALYPPPVSNRFINMETISFEVSQDLLAALKIGSNQLVESMRLLAAIAYFQDKKLSLGKAAELAGIND